jgi:hypothetical protein
MSEELTSQDALKQLKPLLDASDAGTLTPEQQEQLSRIVDFLNRILNETPNSPPTD